MTAEIFTRRTLLPAPPEAVFRWHTRPGALERLMPPWLRMCVLERQGGIRDGGRVRLRLFKGPFHFDWDVEHFGYVENRQFCDRQIRGPFAHWEHRHFFEPEGAAACFVEDRIEYRLPMGAAGRLAAGRAVRRELERMFIYRHRVLQQDVAACLGHRIHPRMNILVTGSSGLIGSALRPFLETCHHQVARLPRVSRDGGPPPARAWDPEKGAFPTAALEGFDAVIHLAGENIAARRWTRKEKELIRNSRIKGTRHLCEALARLDRPPKVLIAASATGYYGDRGAEMLDEDSAPGAGFLPAVCREWEEATAPAAGRGIRVVNLRFGVVLTPAGGALASMLPAFRAGLGGPMGSGWQFMSWVAMDDVIGAVQHALLTESLRGPVNVVSPQPVSNRDFSRVLGRVLNRPAFFRMPAFALKILLGEMAGPLLLAGARVQPRRLLETGYAFRYPDLEDALRHLLGREPA